MNRQYIENGQLRSFNISIIDNLETSPVMFIIGQISYDMKKRLFKVLFEYLSEINRKIIITTTPEFYEKKSNTNIFSSYDNKIVHNLINQQLKVRKEAFILFDNVLNASSFNKNDTLYNLLIDNKKIKIFVIIVNNYPFLIPLEIKSKIDFTFIFGLNNIENTYKNYCYDIFPTYDNFLEIMQQNIGVIILNYSTTFKSIYDKIYSFNEFKNFIV